MHPIPDMAYCSRLIPEQHASMLHPATLCIDGQDFATYLPIFLSLSYLDSGGSGSPVTPLRGSHNWISMTSVKARGGDITHYLARGDTTAGAHVHLTAYTQVLGSVLSLSRVVT
jgi:hypothetical protein